MDLPAAIACIEKSFSKLDSAYGRTVFDELAIVSFSDQSLDLHYYQGASSDAFLDEFSENSISLRKELIAEQTDAGGEFSFTREGEGANMDAYICLGPKVFLFCNNTEKSMEEVSRDPAWLSAQGEFLLASQRFAVDPLSL